jgi:hypothetical protein
MNHAMAWWMGSKKFEGLFAWRPSIYILVVLAAIPVAFAYQFRTSLIFSCQAAGYSADRYLGACNGARYGDYEHGAFWFDLEPAAETFAKNADVLFLGDSRLQIALSTAATSDWFTAASVRYYLLGFYFYGNMIIADAVLDKILPFAKVYVINVDGFFETSESPPVKTILHDSKAREQYKTKRLWQRVHEPICKAVPTICGDKFAIFRSRQTGAYMYTLNANQYSSAPVSYDEVVDQQALNRNRAAGIEFLSRLPVRRECMILTIVPAVGTKKEGATALARALGLKLIIPENTGELWTFDGVHLDQASAQRWSQAFLQAAGTTIRSCL